MLTNNHKSLLYYWSVRYFLIMLASSAIVGMITLYAIQKSALSNQYNGMKQMVRDIGKLVEEHGGELPEDLALNRYLIDKTEQYRLQNRPIMFIMDKKGRIVQQFPEAPPHEAAQLRSRLADIQTGGAHIFALKSQEGHPPFLVAVHPVKISSSITGYVLYLMPKVNALQGLLHFRFITLIGLATCLFIGWGIVYLMTQRLVKPIQEAVDAANQIVAGDYNIQLDKKHDEKEVHELMQAFKEMAERLSRLEALRTQLLAGVTHELKTPITSISGLIQAVREGVVNGEEAEAFLDSCLRHSNRLQKMVEDLLDFNSFASNAVTVRQELFDLKNALTDITTRWRLSQKQQALELVVEAESDDTSWQVLSDPIRIEQIMVNLLNNAKDAMIIAGTIRVQLSLNLTELQVQVRDMGQGIPAAEQENVFEPFYRGENKKRRVRGLGLGLPFSKLVARSLGGDLVLSESKPGKTIFTLSIPANGSC
ncbi:HAMP domain-containing sensor histidine kinase [Paenibacillus thalictri]|uniref:histidine kinase n=1 Tax=Paenibacillus thalictri TaxID=2527873 RepID=A0A4Q9DL82_9BACL|nr:HAMP domain-containing sensor histidine kinase [Paenibacillus thalictri]TBL72657.1 HAMP domain-containing histidine kinase [Paenibacillus thalictri]